MAGHVLPHDLLGTGDHRVLVLHGWMGDRTSFDSVRPHLDTSRFSYAFVDYRGYGEAMDVDGEHTVAEASADALATATALGWDTFSLVGHSMGGMVAQHVLLAAPERVRSLVGVSPVPASGVAFDEQGWQLFSGAAANPEHRRTIVDMTTGNRLPASWLNTMVERSLARSNPTAFHRYLDSFAHTDIRDQVLGNDIPVLVFAGAHDPALSPDVMRSTWLEWYPNSELAVFTDAGHYAPDEVPLALVSQTEGFLAR